MIVPTNRKPKRAGYHTNERQWKPSGDIEKNRVGLCEMSRKGWRNVFLEGDVIYMYKKSGLKKQR